MGWTKLLQGGQLDEATRERAVATIDRNARAQTQLIEDILDVSRIIAGKLSLNVRAVDLGAVIDGALDSVRHAAEAKGVRLVTEVPRGLGPFEGDADRCSMWPWNLISNAINFTSRGGKVRSPCASGRHAELASRTWDRHQAGVRPHVFERFRTDPEHAPAAAWASASPSCATSSSCTAGGRRRQRRRRQGATFTFAAGRRGSCRPRGPAGPAVASTADPAWKSSWWRRPDARELIAPCSSSSRERDPPAVRSASEGLAALAAATFAVRLSESRCPVIPRLPIMRAVRARPRAAACRSPPP